MLSVYSATRRDTILHSAHSRKRRAKAKAKARARERGQIKERAKANPQRRWTAVVVGTAAGNISARNARRLEKEAMSH